MDDLFFFFFIALGLELSDTTSLQALNTSPPRNRFSLQRSNCSCMDDLPRSTYHTSASTSTATNRSDKKEEDEEEEGGGMEEKEENRDRLGTAL